MQQCKNILDFAPCFSLITDYMCCNMDKFQYLKKNEITCFFLQSNKVVGWFQMHIPCHLPSFSDLWPLFRWPVCQAKRSSLWSAPRPGPPSQTPWGRSHHHRDQENMTLHLFGGKKKHKITKETKTPLKCYTSRPTFILSLRNCIKAESLNTR